MTQEASHPDRWAYGGVIERVRWQGDPATIRRWDGRSEIVQPGDTLLVLQTGVPWAQTVGVEG